MDHESESSALRELEILEKFLKITSEKEVLLAASSILKRVKLTVESIRNSPDENLVSRFDAIFEEILEYLSPQKITAIKNKKAIITNINIDITKKQPRVLICYTTDPFLHLVFGNKDIYSHTNFYEALQIIHFFIYRDFIIDVVDCIDISVLPIIENVKYDFIFGLGKIFYYMVKKYPDVNNCIYVTENFPDFAYEREKERINYFYERHEIKLTHARTGLYSLLSKTK